MKSTTIFLILIFFFCFNTTLQSAVCYWDGEANDGFWASPTNWSGNTVPQPGDDVILDNSLVNGNYLVYLPSGNINVVVNSILISPASGWSISLILPASNTANPGLSVTGPANSLVLNNNSVLKNSSGAAAGSGLSVSNSFRINNGGRYIHNTTRGNASIVSQLSSAPGTETGVFEFDVPAASYVLSLSGRTFGSLVLSSVANNGTVSYSGTGASNLTINGSLEINTGVSFSTSMSASIIIKGDFLQSISSTFNVQSSTNNNVIQLRGNFTSSGTITETNSGLPVLEFNGTTQQVINAGGASFLNLVDLKINNPAGALLSGNLVLPYRLSIQNGNLILGNNFLTTGAINQINPATLSTNHIVTNGTGYLKINNVTNAIFPIGPTVSSYNPLSVSNGGGRDYSVRVEEGIQPSIAFPTYGINRTWHIQASVVSNGVHVSFQYASADANAGATQPQDMELLMYSGNSWNIVPGNTNIFPGGADPSWVIQTSNPLTINNTSTAYALGVDGGWALPVGCTSCPLISGAAERIKEMEVFILPNPVLDKISLKIKSSSKDFIRLAIINVSGIIITQRDLWIDRGTNVLQIPFEVTGGVYFLKIENEKVRKVIWFLKFK